MKRREWMLGALAAPWVVAPRAVLAHHGWSSFDQDRPIYLEGKVLAVRWANPHAELDVEVPANLKLPADLANRAVPAQTAPVDGRALLARAVVPTRKDRQWEIELAPLTRMETWKVPEIKVGESVSMLGFTLMGEKGEAVVRVEYLYLAGKAYALRSSPA
jgi:Family of unknown function (DUF6152)